MPLNLCGLRLSKTCQSVAIIGGFYATVNIKFKGSELTLRMDLKVETGHCEP